MVDPAPLYADRGYGRTYTAADRPRSGKTSTPGRLINGHLKPSPNLHHLDGRSRIGAAHRSITQRFSCRNSWAWMYRSTRPPFALSTMPASFFERAKPIWNRI